MEVKIGIADVARELTVNSEATPDELVAQLQEALAGTGLLTLTDDKGRRVIVPAARIAYLDLGATDARPVGFGALR